MGAIASDTQDELRWCRKGCALAADVAKGLVYLHSKKVRPQGSPHILPPGATAFAREQNGVSVVATRLACALLHLHMAGHGRWQFVCVKHG